MAMAAAASATAAGATMQGVWGLKAVLTATLLMPARALRVIWGAMTIFCRFWLKAAELTLAVLREVKVASLALMSAMRAVNCSRMFARISYMYDDFWAISAVAGREEMGVKKDDTLEVTDVNTAKIELGGAGGAGGA